MQKSAMSMISGTLQRHLIEFSANSFVEKTTDDLIAEINRQGLQGVVFGASGGIDSLVAAALCIKAKKKGEMGPVIGLQMTDSRIKGEIYNDGIYRRLGVDLIRADITDEAVEMEKRYHMPPRWLSLLLMKCVVRCMPSNVVRSMILYVLSGEAPAWVQAHYSVFTHLHLLRLSRIKDYANCEGLLIVICANRTEISLGYFVEGGVDDPAMGHFAPISRLYKTQVIRAAQFLKVPERVIRQKPSPGFGGIHDEDLIGPYEAVDPILVGLTLGYTDEEILESMSVHSGNGRIEDRFKTAVLCDVQYVQFLRQLVEISSEKEMPGKPGGKSQ
jgi:NAD+ synthase